MFVAVYYRDIAELTQQVNRLDNQLNLLSEENEALREQCGLGSEDAVDVGPLRSKKNAELEQLKKDSHTLQQQVYLQLFMHGKDNYGLKVTKSNLTVLADV